MLLYDWTWWGHLTNQKEGCAGGARRGARRGVQRGARRGAWRGVQRGAWRGMWRGCTEGCAEGCTEGCAEGCAEGSLIAIGCPATTDLVVDNREFEAFRHILSCYTHYSWLIVLHLQSFITICPWLPLVAPSNH